MIKKTISFMMIVVMVFGIVLTIKAQDKSYMMWESVTITPDHTKLKVLGENMKKHNQKYHKDGPYKAYVYNITTGPNIGKLVWEMGPLKYADLDGRPSSGGHDDDWRDNIMPYVKKMSNGEYWKKDIELSNTAMLAPNTTSHPLLFIRYHEVVKGEGHNVNHLLTQISKTVKAMDGENPWGVYYNEFQQGYTIGRHISTVSFYKTWAELDEDQSFKKTFMKVHGENSWQTFLENMNDTFSNSWDEVWEFNSKLSGHK
ncbi:MAG: hypothetical protein JKY16_04605 [Lutibacter sp.]|nr:hypothetical protein [Lutibacter sp.]